MQVPKSEQQEFKEAALVKAFIQVLDKQQSMQQVLKLQRLNFPY